MLKPGLQLAPTRDPRTWLQHWATNTKRGTFSFQAYRCLMPVSASVSTQPSPCVFSSPKESVSFRTLVLGFKARHNPRRSSLKILHLIMFAKTFPQNKIIFTDSRRHIFWGPSIQPTIDLPCPGGHGNIWNPAFPLGQRCGPQRSWLPSRPPGSGCYWEGTQAGFQGSPGRIITVANI